MSRRRALAALAAVVLGGLWTLLGPAGAASAHAVLVSMSPPPDALLDAAPERVTIEFNEPVDTTADSLTVTDGSGAVISSDPVVEGATVSVEVPATAQGWHAVSWRVVSSDGHPLSGAWTFRIGEGSAEAPAGLEEQASDAASASTTSRWVWIGGQLLSSLATVVLVGTTFLAVAGLRREGPSRPGLGFLAGMVAIAASLLAAAANGPFSVGGGLADELFTGPASGAHLARALLATAATVVVVWWGTRRSGAAAVAFVASAAAVAVVPASTGHAPTDGVVARVAVAAHLVVAACWLGAVPALLLALRDRQLPALTTLGRFSLAAGRLLAAAVVLGVVAALVLSGGPDDINARWGWYLALKVALVAVAVAAGTWNRWHVRAGGGSGRRVGPGALLVEAMALVAVVGASVAMTHNGPPSEEAAAGPAVVDLRVSDEVRVQLVVDPARTGTNWVHLYTLDPAGLPLEVQDVTVAFSNEARGIEPIEQQLSDAGNGHRLGISDDFGLPGVWRAHVSVRVDRFTEVAGEATLAIEG